MKRVLIITYYWVPSGGAGVQRWLKFSKYLPDFGWQPVIYTPSNPEYPSIDHSLEKDLPDAIEIIKQPIWEPYNIYRKVFGKKDEAINAGFISENKSKNRKDKLAVSIRGNFLIPDPRRFWVRPSVAFLSNYLQKHAVDAIITTGPPHSMHLIGYKLKKLFPQTPWLADFRDPWTNIDFYKDLNLTHTADKIHHRLEKKIIESTDCLITVSPSWKLDFPNLFPKKTALITNGYDQEDVQISDGLLDEKFSISHIGTLNEARNPELLWKVLEELSAENDSFKKDLCIQLIGKTDYSVIESIKNHDLLKNTAKIDYVSHSEAIKKQQSSQVLLLLINKSANAKTILTGKFFEYIASKRPILAIGPKDGDLANILNETNSGLIADFDDKTQMKRIISNYYTKYKAKNLSIEDSSNTLKYSRKFLTSRLCDLLNSL